MPSLDINTNNDAEVFILDAALSRVARSVGSFKGDLDPGLYKIRVNRAGTLREQLVELSDQSQVYGMYISHFATIAPIGPMLPERGRVESLASAALGKLGERGILVLAHQAAENADHGKLFKGVRIFPWRAPRDCVLLDELSLSSDRIGNELWTAVAFDAGAANGPFVLELSRGGQIARQAILVAKGWQTRIFLRAKADDRPRTEAGLGEAVSFDVSIQMARPWFPVVYDDHWQTVEVARSALERGRAIFTSERLVDELFHQKYDNPIAGITGLHLFLDARDKSAAGNAAYDLTFNVRGSEDKSQQIVDEVMINLTALLYPERAAVTPREELVYADPQWPESADLTALRLRAGRIRQQINVPSPPMFRVSWDVLNANAARDGPVWIGRKLWSSTGAAGSAGPYLAWARGRHSVKRTLRRISNQCTEPPGAGGILPRVLDGANAVIGGPSTARSRQSVGRDVSSGRESIASPPAMPTLESIISGEVDDAVTRGLATDFGLPLSIFQKAPGKMG